MKKHLTRRALLCAAASALAAAPLMSVPATALAQSGAYPNRPISMIVPWPAGGSTDRHMRTLAELASKELGQPIIVENKPGAGGTLGPSTMAMQAKPDGYTISQFPLGMLRYPHMNKTNWHPINDFTFIIGVSGYTFGFVVKADSPYKTFQEYIDAARKSPGTVDYGSTGTGTSPHLILEEISAEAKVQLNHIPFRGNADIMQAILGGHVQAGSDATGWDKFVDAGQMRLLVTFGENRTKRWPDVPTAKDLGYNVVSQSPYGLVGPKGMDPAIVKTLHDAFKKAIENPRNIEVLGQLNQESWYRNGADYKAWAEETYNKDKELITRLGLAAK
ncbi:MAG: tripartite tricarboxylate transporter substrate binding protein [Alcaligenaceae bacterium]|nr:tripartite tricarboxylate transporter substrate binding protein [Alcaligenaceae bacterium]